LDGAARPAVAWSGHDSVALAARPRTRPGLRCKRPPACRTLETVPEDLRVNSWLVIPAGELRERFSRSSGPGGQSVNTTDSRAELSFDIAGSPTLPAREKSRALSRLAGRLTDGVVTVAAETERSQLMNREAARDRLATLLREAVAPPPPPRVPTKPSRGAKERRLAEKRRRGQTKRLRRPDADD
jgi:ribosome-associated protein